LAAAASRISLRVRDDRSVNGLDDTVLASAMWPRRKSMRQPLARLAASSVTVLARRFAG
jgi:LacI family transcriptional regulator